MEMEAVTAGIEGRKTDTGTMKISSAPLTALDLLRYPQASGGIGNVATILSDVSLGASRRREVASRGARGVAVRHARRSVPVAGADRQYLSAWRYHRRCRSDRGGARRHGRHRASPRGRAGAGRQSRRADTRGGPRPPDRAQRPPRYLSDRRGPVVAPPARGGPGGRAHLRARRLRHEGGRGGPGARVRHPRGVPRCLERRGRARARRRRGDGRAVGHAIPARERRGGGGRHDAQRRYRLAPRGLRRREGQCLGRARSDGGCEPRGARAPRAERR